jgi:small-conductance mechanosensitive channel
LKTKTSGEGPNSSDAAGSANQAADPAQATVLAPIESQLRSNQLEITNRERSIATLKVKIDDYQARLNQEPIREQQLADLTRGYDQSKVTYDELLKKKNESKMATSMELLQQGERFRVVDPPSLPQKPNSPNRLKFCGIGLGTGLALGGIFVAAFEMMDDRLHTEKEIKELSPANVLAEIPSIVTASDAEQAKRAAWLGWATAVLVFAFIVAGSAYSYLRG